LFGCCAAQQARQQGRYVLGPSEGSATARRDVLDAAEQDAACRIGVAVQLDDEGLAARVAGQRVKRVVHVGFALLQAVPAG
jgi:hypothetical protein